MSVPKLQYISLQNPSARSAKRLARELNQIQAGHHAVRRNGQWCVVLILQKES